MNIRHTFNTTIDAIFEYSPYFAVVCLVVGLTMMGGCSSMAGFVDKATEPGKDERCVTGLGMEFCYFRERTVVQPTDTDVQPE